MSMERGYKETVHEQMQDVNYAMVITEYAARMNKGFYPQETLDFVVQKHYREPYDIYDAAAYAPIHSAIATGTLIGCSVTFGEHPSSDNQIDAMNVSLSRLPDPFYAEFQGGPGSKDSDGYFGWDAPILLKSAALNPKCGVPAIKQTVDDMYVPLEVGTTKPHTSYYHLATEYGLARWPYGYDYIIVWVATGGNNHPLSKIATNDFAREMIRQGVVEIADPTIKG